MTIDSERLPKKLRMKPQKVKLAIFKGKTIEELAKTDPNAVLKLPKNLYETYRNKLEVLHRQHVFGKRSYFHDEGYNFERGKSPISRNDLKIGTVILDKMPITYRENPSSNLSSTKYNRTGVLTKRSPIAIAHPQSHKGSLSEIHNINVILKNKSKVKHNNEEAHPKQSYRDSDVQNI